jgi:hypothetical protein
MTSVDDQIRIQILHVPGCPLVAHVRELVRQALARTRTQAEVEERVGDYPSPTLLIDGRDVTGRSPGGGTACRLDLPTEQQVQAALARRSPSATVPSCPRPTGGSALPSRRGG